MLNFVKSCNWKKTGILLVLTMIFCLFCFLGSLEAKEAKYQFKIACADPLWGEGGILLQSFAASVNYLTGGDIQIEIFPAGELGGSEDEFCAQLQQGTLDFAAPSTSPISQYSDALYMFDTPFLFKGAIEEVLLTFETATKHTELVEKKLNKATEEAGFIVLAVAPLGRRDILSNKPVRSADDLKGMKIRVMNNPVQIDAFNFLGAIATPLAYSECFNALQLNVVDAVENSPAIYIDMGFYEVAPYYFATNHYSCVQTLSMSQKAWDSLPRAYQTIVKEAAVGASSLLANWTIGAHEVFLNGRAKEAAKEMIYIDEDEKAKLRAEILPKLLDKYSEQIGMDVIEILAKDDEIVQNWYNSNQ